MNDFDSWLPSDRIYDGATYMWAKPERGSGMVRIGASQPTLDALGDLAYLALSDNGAALTRGKSAGSMEAAKMTGEIISPVSGTVVARNEEVIENPGLVNQEPYGSGWLLEIKPNAWDSESAELEESRSLYDRLPDELRKAEPPPNG